MGKLGCRPHNGRITQEKVIFINSLDTDHLIFRRNRFDGEPETKKNRPDPRREGSGFERYPKSFDGVRRTEPPPPSGRSDLRDTDRREIRDRDERRPVSMSERPAGGRAPPPAMSHSRSGRDTGHTGWKNDSGISTKPSDVR